MKIEVVNSRCFIIIIGNLARSLFLHSLLSERYNLVRVYCVGFMHTPARYFPCIYKVCSGEERQRDGEKGRERKREHAREGPTTRDHTSKTLVYVLARRRHLHILMYQYRQTARPIYSTALFSTLFRHGSPYYTTIIPFTIHALPSQRYLAPSRKKEKHFRARIVSQVLPRSAS